jgi:hypothetical protein
MAGRFSCVSVFITAGPSTKLLGWRVCVEGVCVCLLLQDLVQSCLHGCVCVCVYYQDLVQSCWGVCGGGIFVCVCVFITAGPSTKLFTGGGGGVWGELC